MSVTALIGATETTQSPAVLIIAVAVALISASAAIASPLIVSSRQRKNDAKDRAKEEVKRLRERNADLERTEAIRQAVAATKVEAAAARTVAERAASSTARQLGEIKVVADQTHLLVNSNMMKEMRLRLVSMDSQLALNRRIIVLNEKLGVEVTQEDLGVIQTLEAEIRSSRASLVDLEERTAGAAEIAAAAADE
jgi:hypothetical protein